VRRPGEQDIEVRGIRTVIVALSPLLAEIIRRMTETRVPLDVVATLQTRELMLQHLQLLSPALILLGLDRGEDDAVAAMLAGMLAGVRVLAFASDARRISVHEAGKPQRGFADASAEELMAVIGEDLNPAAGQDLHPTPS
jgi:chemotaxis response regulator CheB